MIMTQTEKGGGLKFCALASGSKGNALYVSDGATSILIDAGLTGKELERRMAMRDIVPESLSAVVVSHEHTDHVKGVGVLCRRYGLTAYCTRGTWESAAPGAGKIENIRYFSPGKAFPVGTLLLHPFSTSHDARDPAGFTIAGAGAKIGIATDLGIATAVVRRRLAGCRALLLEANHDVKMLLEGPYPWHLKQRIKGRSGHLSNEDSRDLLSQLLHEGLAHVILGHLSETNNTPELALDTVRPALDGLRASLTAARQDLCGDLLEIFGDGPV